MCFIPFVRNRKEENKIKPILIITPHRKIQSLSKKIIRNYDGVDVKLGLLNKGVELCKGIESKGVEAIISRGGTARMIEEVVSSIPVVEIPVSPYDLLKSIHSAKKYGKNIIVMGFENVIEGAELLGPILDINIQTYHIDNEEDGEMYIKQLINSGKKIDALLGGTVAESLAFKYEIPTVQLETGGTAIKLSIKEAKRLVEVARREKEKTKQVKAILHYINEGVVSIDNNGKVITFNSAAGKIMNYDHENVIGQPINKLISNTRLMKVIKERKPELGELFEINKKKVLTNRVPIIVNNKTVGAVATFQDVTKIQKYEEKIRRELVAKGHIAKYSFSDIIGRSEILLETKEKAKRYAATPSTVLIVGASGTGKEMFAQSIHLESARKNRPFVAVNCAAIPNNLLESELFGYEEGAFSGARKKGKSGLFVEAHRGTIFLDEIGEISAELQTRLLRVLQEKEVRPIGSNKVIPIDVRIIAATNKDLIAEVKEGNFRSDLYYRLNILKLSIPSLKDRREDVKLLSKYFIDKVASKYNKIIEISDDALNMLEHYNWPGNIRELENIIERLVVLNSKIITVKQIEEIFCDYQNDDCGEGNSLDKVKKRHILRVLSECQGNKTKAADILGISRTHLWRMLKSFE